jgi:hypothetical protein
MATKEKYWARKTEQQAKYKNKILERLFGWWRNPPDRFVALVALFTALLFFATIALWLSTKDLVLDAQHNTEASNRAWLTTLGVPQLVRPVEEGQSIRFVILFANPGHEPATDINIRILNSTVPAFDTEAIGNDKYEVPEEKVCEGVDPAIGRNMLSPTGASKAAWNFDSKIGHPPFVADDSLVKKTRFYVVNGCAAYHTFEKPRWSWFCYILEPQHQNQITPAAPSTFNVPFGGFQFGTCGRGLGAN